MLWKLIRCCIIPDVVILVHSFLNDLRLQLWTRNAPGVIIIPSKRVVESSGWIRYIPSARVQHHGFGKARGGTIGLVRREVGIAQVGRWSGFREGTKSFRRAALWLPTVSTLKLYSVYALINASPSRYGRRLRRLSYDSALFVPWLLLSRHRYNAPWLIPQGTGWYYRRCISPPFALPSALRSFLIPCQTNSPTLHRLPIRCTSLWYHPRRRSVFHGASGILIRGFTTASRHSRAGGARTGIYTRTPRPRLICN